MLTIYQHTAVMPAQCAVLGTQSGRMMSVAPLLCAVWAMASGFSKSSLRFKNWSTVFLIFSEVESSNSGALGFGMHTVWSCMALLAACQAVPVGLYEQGGSLADPSQGGSNKTALASFPFVAVWQRK